MLEEGFKSGIRIVLSTFYYRVYSCYANPGRVRSSLHAANASFISERVYAKLVNNKFRSKRGYGVL